MKDIGAYIESGILELYVMGMITEEERNEVEMLAAQNESVRREIEEISQTLEKLAREHSADPHPTVKPLFLASINFAGRMYSGEEPSFPPILNENSKAEDYKQWTERKEFDPPADFEEIHARIIGYTPEVTTAIVWIKHMAPDEVHDNEYEKFLILEGTCEITIGNDIHRLGPGDYLTIPLHTNHFVTVTSKIPCKVILQRVAA